MKRNEIILVAEEKIDQHCGYCLGEGKVTKAFYKTQNNVPVCRGWETKVSHKNYIKYHETKPQLMEVSA
jgi:hypothetical protein